MLDDSNLGGTLPRYSAKRNLHRALFFCDAPEARQVSTRIVIAGGKFAKVGAAMYFDKILPAATPWSDHNRPRNFVLFSSMPHEVPAGNLSPGGTTSLRSFQAHLLYS